LVEVAPSNACEIKAANMIQYETLKTGLPQSKIRLVMVGKFELIISYHFLLSTLTLIHPDFP
jgi:hypothetical protein